MADSSLIYDDCGLQNISKLFIAISLVRHVSSTSCIVKFAENFSRVETDGVAFLVFHTAYTPQPGNKVRKTEILHFLFTLLQHTNI
jgi:hypothetical protein